MIVMHIFAFVCCFIFSNGNLEKVHLTSPETENIFQEFQKLKLQFDVMQNEMNILKEQQWNDKQEIKDLKKGIFDLNQKVTAEKQERKALREYIKFLEERGNVNGYKDPELRPATSVSPDVRTHGLVFTPGEQKEDPSAKETVENIEKRGSAGNGTFKVAFNVKLRERLGHLGLNHPIPFDEVKTNISATYNTHTGIFTCSVPGTYVFFSMMKFNHGHSAIVKNGSIYSYMGHESSDDFETSSNMAIMNLNVGDTVWVTTVTESVNDVDIGSYSTFTGFLLYPNLK